MTIDPPCFCHCGDNPGSCPKCAPNRFYNLFPVSDAEDAEFAEQAKATMRAEIDALPDYRIVIDPASPVHDGRDPVQFITHGMIEMLKHEQRMYESFYSDPDGPPMYEAEPRFRFHSQPDRGEVE